MNRSILTAAAAIALAAGGVFGQTDAKPDAAPAKTLTIGDKAPKLDVEHWVKGEKLEAFEPGKVYVVEFWATWCGPCRASMPHVSELQERYADYGVRVVGITREELKVVTDFLAKADQSGGTWSDKMRYAVGVDPDNSVNDDYMKAAGQNGIPTSFIVGKDGKVEWIGHPMRMDDPLAAVVRDTWDRAAYKAEFEAAQKAEAAQRRMQTRMRELTRAGDWDGMVKLLDEAIAENPDSLALQMQKFETLLVRLDRADEAYALGQSITAKGWENAALLNQIAWMVVDTEGIKTRNLDFALRTALRANELSKGKDGAILDTVARCHFEKGDLKEAVEFQKKAVEFAPAGPMADELKANLEKYEKALAEKRKK